MTRARPLLCAALCALFVAACRDAAQSAGAPGTHAVLRPALRSVATEAPRPRRSVCELEPALAWTTGSDASLAPYKPGGDDERPFLHLEHAEREDGDDPALLLDPTLGPFNRVEVELAIKQANAQTRSALIVATSAGGRELVREVVPVPLGPGVHRIAVDLPYRARWAGRPETLRLRLRGAERWAVGRVTLVEDDWAARLPPPEGPAAIAIDQETRPCVGLTSARPLELALTPPPDAELLVGWGVPHALRSDEQSPVLVVTVRAGARVVREARAPLRAATSDGRPDERAGWRDLRLPLAGLAGELTVRFELEVDGRLPAFAALATPLVVRRSRAAPTVLLISSDTHRFDHLREARAGVELDTPVLDRLAREGVFYEGCFSSTNVTNPSHAALLTGIHPRDTRVLDNVTALTDEAATLAEAFRDAGYLTFACVSVPHLDHERSGLGQGFDRMSAPPFAKRPAEDTIALLDAWLAEAHDAPAFAWLHLFDAHTPYAPPAGFDRRYYPPGRDPYDPALPEPPRHMLPQDDARLRDLEFPAAQYRAEVTYLDQALARLLDRPRVRAGIVLFTADHGESLGAHDIYWGHGGLYPDTVHVPLILRYPGVPAGTRVRAPVRQIDAGRTLLDLAGLEQVPFDGRSLLEPLTRPDAASHPGIAREARYLLAAHAQEAAVHSGRWLLILYLDDPPPHGGATRVRHQVELYDLERDPGCRADRAASDPDTARALRKDLIAWLGARRSQGFQRNAPGGVGTEEQLAALGYTGDTAPLYDDAPFIDPECACPRCALFQ